MKKALVLDSALGFVFGIIICSILFFVSRIFTYPDGTTTGILLSVLFLPIIEEVAKFIPLKLSLCKENHIWIGLFVGFGFAVFENLTYIYNQGAVTYNRIPATILHITTGVIMGYFISKKKSWIGLILAIILHGAFNSLFISQAYNL